MIWIVVLIALALRLISLDQSLWLDEAINTLAVKNYHFFDLITQYARADFHPPGWFILLWFWTKIFGYSEIAVRLPSVIFGIFNVWIVYLIGKKMHSEKTGLILAILIGVNPLHIYYSQEARMYLMATLAVSANMLLLYRLLKGEKINLLVLILSNVFLLSADYLAYFIFPAQLILLLLYKKNFIKQWFFALIVAVLLGIWWLPIFVGQFNVGSLASAHLPSWKLISGAFDYKTIPLTFAKFIIGRISISNKLIYAAVLLPVYSLFFYVLWQGIKAAGDFNRKFLLAWMIVPIILATIVSIFIPIYNYFRVLFVLPSFLSLLSFGILPLTKRIRYLILTIIILIEVFSSLIYLLNPAFHREDWRGLVSSFENKQKNFTILFESSGVLPPFQYYSKKKLNAFGALKDFPATDEKKLADLASLLDNRKEVYLVDYLVEISDPDRLVAKKLNKLNFYQANVENFNAVGFVFHYLRND